MKTNWHPQNIPTLIESIYSIIRGHYTDLERAFIGRGDFSLDDNYARFTVHAAAWENKTDKQRKQHWDKFMKALKTNTPKSTSADGNLHILSSVCQGKKPGQVKRKRAAKTTTRK